MALPEDVSTFTLNFGEYYDAAGQPAFKGMTGKLVPSRSPIMHTDGSVLVSEPVPVTIDAFGVASVELVCNDYGGGFTYSMVWDVASRRPSPGNLQAFSVTSADASVQDFDALAESEATPGVFVPRGAKGDVGPSAYDVAITNGFSGTLNQWLASLVGPPGVADDASMTAIAANPTSAFAVTQRAASGTVAATATASGALVPQKHNPVDATGGAKTMTLPAGQVEGTTLSVEKMDSSANTVTITGHLRGSAGQSIALAWSHETITFRADAAGSWWPISGHKTKASLDAVFGAPAVLTSPEAKASFGRVAAFPKAQGAVCFVWDDGYADHHTVRQMADARGQRHTFAINSGLLGQTNRMTTAQVLAAYQAGHEIASHGVDHLNMAAQTVATRTAQYDQSKTALEAIVGAGNVTTFVYPNGTSGRNSATDQELYGRYRRLRTTTSPLGGQGQNRYRIDDREAFLIGAQAWYDSQNMVFEQIKDARDTNTIVVIYAHAFGTGAGNGTNEPSLAQVTAVMDYAQSIGIPCVTLAEAFPGHPLIRDPGFEQFAIGDTAWYYQGSANPGAYAEIVTDTPDVGMPGTKSLHLVATGAGTFSYVGQSIPVIPGRTYTISGRYRTVGISSATNAVALRTRGRDYLGAYTGGAPTYGNLFSNTWARFTLDMAIGQDTTALAIEPIVNAVAAELFIDHLHVGLKSQGAFG